MHDIARSAPAYAGLLGWAGIDYATLNNLGRDWQNIRWAGVLDCFRVPKPGAAFYRSQMDPRKRPIIVPVFFWDFGPNSPATGPGPGTMMATNCDRLELYVDDRHFATGTPDTVNYPNLTHPPVFVDLTVDGATRPELRIDGYLCDDLVRSVRMSSDPAGDRLALAVEDDSIDADGVDMTRYTFRAIDAHGNQRPNVSGLVTLSLSGPATLIGDNPFAFGTYGGVGGGFIRSRPGETGLVTITVHHRTLASATRHLAITPGLRDTVGAVR